MDRDGIRFIYSSLIPNFESFTAVSLMIRCDDGSWRRRGIRPLYSLVRNLVLVSPAWALTYFLAFAGSLSSVAADTCYLVLLPPAGVSYASGGHHPLAGYALCFVTVTEALTVNMLIKRLGGEDI